MQQPAMLRNGIFFIPYYLSFINHFAKFEIDVFNRIFSANRVTYVTYIYGFQESPLYNQQLTINESISQYVSVIIRFWDLCLYSDILPLQILHGHGATDKL